MSTVNVKPVDSRKSHNHFLKKEAKRFQEDYMKKVDYNVRLSDFDRLSTLGAGTYGRVMLVKEKSSEKYFALKLLDKEKIINMEQVEHTLNEKRILQSIRHPFLMSIEYFFQDNCYIYFVMPFIIGGELFGLIKKFELFSEEMSKFYSAQVCLGLEYLHALKLVYRDLKPENILIDPSGYIKITDFGFCKLVTGRTYTLCGTPEYIAPEIVLTRGYNQAVDWWSFGILIFEMNAGYPPFRHKDPLVLYEKIVAGHYKSPTHFSIGLRDIMRNILQVDLSKRFGNLTNGADDIKNHKWYRDTNWAALFDKSEPPPYKPNVTGMTDTSNFGKFDNEPLKVAEIDRFEKEFAEF